MANLLRITNKIEPLGVWDGIPSDSVNSIIISFDFSDDWQDDLICVAQFTQGEKSYNQIIENNECVLPSELVTGDVVLSVFATKSDGTAFRETAIPFCFEIFNSGFSSTADTPIPPTPDLYEQLIEKFSKNVVNSLNGKTDTVEIVPNGGIDIETTEDGKIKIKSTVSIEIDTEMSDTSENPVQNKVVKQYTDNKIDELGNEVANVLSEDVLPLIAQKLDTIVGGTVSGNVEFTGDVVIANAPTVPSAAVNKEYADSLKTTVDTEMSDTSENPVQNKVLKQYIDTNAKVNKRIKFVLADLGDACSCGFTQSDAHVLFKAQFDLSKLDVTIPQGYDYAINSVEIEGETFALSMLDSYVKSFETYSSDYGYGWEVEGDVYIFYHEYNFGTAANAQAAVETLNADLPITGFNVELDYYEAIQAELKQGVAQ